MSKIELELPKFTVSTRIKKHCSGCGLSFQIEMLNEPLAFEYEEGILMQIRHAIHSLSKAPCPSCKKKKAKQIDWFGF